MTGDAGGRSSRRLVLLASIFLQLIPGLSDNPSTPDGVKADTHPNSRSNTGLKVLFILLGVATLVVLSVFLFKKWQKRKREEQHARLLKLFEDDNELELELGLHD
ncbi:uncharacterized protein LOC120106679 [Phoenix dactylifera]|uniref:Uncharacterized protein LOC103701622 n=1 Tax=Phoenix dactylifera TaxID=42345 RepID=A0A8B8ZN40_PHODC|nr:uncharacterized protein LOC103701622 [Phoenix dactylifera]XP_038975641.1 uncharacterized protein LOC120106679 [Phoenix dactylifera]